MSKLQIQSKPLTNIQFTENTTPNTYEDSIECISTSMSKATPKWKTGKVGFQHMILRNSKSEDRFQKVVDSYNFNSQVLKNGYSYKNIRNKRKPGCFVEKMPKLESIFSSRENLSQSLELAHPITASSSRFRGSRKFFNLTANPSSGTLQTTRLSRRSDEKTIKTKSESKDHQNDYPTNK